MKRADAKDVLQMLMDGVDPITGEILDADHVCNQPDVMRALHLAIVALEEPAPKPAKEGNPMVNRNGRLNAGRPWTKADQEELIRLYRQQTPMDEMCRLLQRRKRGVERQLVFLRLAEDTKRSGAQPERTGQPWSDEEKQFLRQQYQLKKPIREIAHQMQRSERSLYYQLLKMCLDDEELEAQEPPPWRKEDTEALRYLYLEGVPIAALATRFQRSEKAIAARLFQMGLIRDLPFSLFSE